MQARNWLLLVVAIVAIGGCAVLGFNLTLDPYGLYRSSSGRALPAYGDDRVAKYLLSARYVPDNFNSILIGSSASANWPLHAIGKLRVYNESLDGGNSVEFRPLVEQALSRPGISVALLTVHPFATLSHNFETVRLEPALRYSPLGSMNLLDAYKEMLRVRLRHGHPVTDSTGTAHWDKLPTVLNPTLQRLFDPATPFEIDPVALAAYRDIIADLRLHHVQIVFIVPPLREDLLRAKQSAFHDYNRFIETSKRPEDLELDFTSTEFADFNRNAANFADGVHLNPEAAAAIVAELNRRIDGWVAAGLLRPPTDPPPSR